MVGYTGVKQAIKTKHQWAAVVNTISVEWPYLGKQSESTQVDRSKENTEVDWERRWGTELENPLGWVAQEIWRQLVETHPHSGLQWCGPTIGKEDGKVTKKGDGEYKT